MTRVHCDSGMAHDLLVEHGGIRRDAETVAWGRARHHSRNGEAVEAGYWLAVWKCIVNRGETPAVPDVAPLPAEAYAHHTAPSPPLFTKNRELLA